MPHDITNPNVMRFLLENYEVQGKRRTAWFIRHRDKMEQATFLQREPRNYSEVDIIAKIMKDGIPIIIRDHRTSAQNRMQLPAATPRPRLKDLQHSHSIVGIGLGDPNEDRRLTRPDTKLTLHPIMRPVDPKFSKIIHTPEPGRARYIKERNALKPEDKYYFPECTNWMYGWRLKDNNLSNKSQYYRVATLTGALRSKVGPQSDPSHYNSSDISGPSKCKHT